jgi:hypothetical protein
VLGEPVDPRLEAIERGLPAAGAPADVQDDDGLGAEAHRVHDLRLQLEVAHGGVGHRR